MSVQLVFSGDLDPSSPNLSARFTGATVFFIEAPLLNAELEIDVFLQVYVSGVLGEIPRIIHLGKIEEQAISLNITDTETASIIPVEYQNTNLEMALLFLASESTFLYATVVKPDCDLCQIFDQNTAINNRLTTIETILAQILAAVNVPVVNTGSLTQSQQFFFLQ